METEKHSLRSSPHAGSIPHAADVFNASSIGLWAFELDEGAEPRMYVDDNMLPLIGLTEQTTPEATYHAWYDHIDPDHYGEVSDAVDKMVSGSHAEVSYPWHHPTRGILYVRCGGVRDMSYTKGIRIEGCHQDISEIVHFQKKHEEKQKALFRQNLDIIDILASKYSAVYHILLDEDSLTPYGSIDESINTAFGGELLPGSSYFKAFRLYVKKLVYPGDQKHMLEIGSPENIRKQLSRQKSFSVTYRSMIDSEPRFCEMTFIKSGDETDETVNSVVLGIVDCDDDIRMRFVNEKLMEEYASIFLVDLKNDNFRFVFRSETSGFPASEGGSYSDTIKEYASRISPEFREEWERLSDPAYVRWYLSKEDRREYVYTLSGVDRTWRRCVCQVLERKGGVPTSFIMTYTALNASAAEKFALDQKIAEQKVELEKQQKLLETALSRAEAANRAKTVFLSNMSHDIRTPMNAIIGFTALAMQKPEDTSRVQGYLSKISVSSHHLLSLINDVLDMSRIESGKIHLEEADCNLSSIVHDLNTILLGQAQAKQQHLYMDSYDITDEDVVCDMLRLHQVLINLLSNAVKFTPAGGNIHFSVRQLSSNGDSASYEFRVKDNGIGMSPEFMQHIFEPFERERTSTASKTQGTGLGMSITKNIIDLMGGTIDVFSEPEKGTEFILRLTMKLQNKSSALTPLESLKNCRALVVDDDPYACDSISCLLNSFGLRTDCTQSGNDAVRLAKKAQEDKDPFSVYVIDWLIPDLNGIDVIRQIRKAVGDDAPIVLSTAYDWNNIEAEARAAGVTSFLSKPLFPSTVHRVLSQAIGITEKESAGAAALHKESFAGRKILLVEDNELNREIAFELLSENGLVVDTAEDGSVAVRKMQTASPGTYDLILMDIQMPIMDGYEASRKIREMGETLPIIAMTANAFSEDRRAAMDAGMNEHLAKPIDTEKLFDMLKKFL